MKRLFLVLALVLTIITSVIAGTMAMYTVTLDDLAEGSVVAKEFILTEYGTDTFEFGVKIAPTETVIWSFGLKNYEGEFVSEVPIDYTVTLTAEAADGKSAIGPLTAAVFDTDNNIVSAGGLTDGVGTLTVNGRFPLEAAGQSRVYELRIYWESTDNDIDYAGNAFETMFNVSVTGVQSEEEDEVFRALKESIAGSAVTYADFLSTSFEWRINGTNYTPAYWNGYLEKLFEAGPLPSNTRLDINDPNGYNVFGFSNYISDKHTILNAANWDTFVTHYGAFLPGAIIITNDSRLAYNQSNNYITQKLPSLAGSVVFYKAIGAQNFETVVYYIKADGTLSECRSIAEILP